MRPDALGFFWRDEPVVKAAKAEKPKRTPPEPVWLAPDYLPGLAEAQAFQVPVFTDRELVHAASNRHKLVFDIEVYPNYFLIAFRSIETGQVVCLEMTEDIALDIPKLNWMLRNFCLISFNGISFDTVIAALAVAGKSCAQLQYATEALISRGERGSDVLREMKTKAMKGIDHIDLIEVAPLRASLKIYGGRLHSPRMQDLPFPPGTKLKREQMDIVRWYCVNDLIQTELLYQDLTPQIDLRESMGREYKMDLRSKSDAQIAEAVIAEEVGRLNGARCQRPEIAVGTRYRYQVPHFIRYQTPLLNWMLDVIRNADFVVSEHGNVGMPQSLSDLKLEIAGATYRMGIGGLHSSEESVSYKADSEYLLIDRDVTSYYPSIILNQSLYPSHLGRNFLRVYKRLVDRRLDAKRSGNKVVADSLKITINGSFGKLGSKYSILYAPDLLIQVTVTGQLSLLMLIERLELVGVHVVSANTDGIVIHCPKARHQEVEHLIAQWERDTSFETEETQYSGYYSRDVNNYVAVKVDGKVKTKGVFATTGLHKNPTNEICVDAVLGLITKGIPLATTIQQSQDIRKFVTIRTVKGGAVKDGVYLGKSVRWYYAQGAGESEMVYANSGNKVPRSDGARPLMLLPASFPTDVDLDWYITEAEGLLTQIGL